MVLEKRWKEICFVTQTNGTKKWDRGHIMEIQDINILKEKIPPIEYHVSVLTYFNPEINDKNSCIDEIILDIDKIENDLEVQKILNEFKISWVKYKTARGFHYHINNIFKFTPAMIENKTVAITLDFYFKKMVDTNPYMSLRGQCRGIGSLNNDGTIKEWVDSISHSHEPVLNIIQPQIKKNISTDNKLIDKFHCIKNILSQPLENYRGNRNNILLRIISHYRSQLISLPNAKEIAWETILQWNDGSFTENELLKKFNYIWEKAYHYGCSDPILSSVCDTRCPFGNQIKSQDMAVKVKQFVDEVSPHGISLKNVFHSMKNNFMLYPGHIITLAGPPASFKTTIAIWIVANLNVPTLFLANDESDIEIYLRALSQVTGYPQNVIYQKIHNGESLPRLDHISFKEIRDPEMIRAAIQLIKPRILVVDHAELIDTKSNGYDAIRERTLFFKSLSQYRDKFHLTVIAISHILRSAARAGEINMHAIKGTELEREGDAIIHTMRTSGDDDATRVQLYSKEKHRQNPGFDIILEINHSTFKVKEIEQ